MDFRRQPLDDAVDRRHGERELAFDVPVPAEALVVAAFAGHQLAIAKVRQRRVVKLHDVNARRGERLRLARKGIRQVLHEMLVSWVGGCAVFGFQ